MEYKFTIRSEEIARFTRKAVSFKYLDPSLRFVLNCACSIFLIFTDNNKPLESPSKT
jgi:hypothetical protein